jgi:hypothetical protein
LEFLHFTSEYVDNGEPVDVIYLDFQKAFDKVPHKRLMMKLNAYGVKGAVATWIQNWLDNREQRVVLNQSVSEWTKVLSGVPQGSVLGPLLFIVYINDIDKSVLSKLSKFADDTKVFSTVSTKAEIEKLRLDLRNLFKWSEDWQMLFNVEKCKIMHFGKNNVKADYSMNGKILEVVNEERDLGVIVQDDLKVSQQCVKVVKTANKVLGMISRTFVCRSKDVILQLYKSLVRPHLEYCIQAWRPHLQKDIKLIESVQKRATKMVDSLKSCSYDERLRKLNLTSLETRRLRGDLIEVFKMFKGFDDVNVHDYFTMGNSSLRGHSLKLFKSRFVSDCDKFSFANQVVNEWNLLTDDIVACDTLVKFKIKLDHYLKHSRGLL